MGVRQRRQAYTLFELVLVLAILTVVAALAFPSVQAMVGNYRQTAAIDKVRAAWAAARAHAMDEGRAYRFRLLPDQGRYRVAPDGIDAGGDGTPASAAAGPDLPFVLEEDLPKGVQVSPTGNTPLNGDAGDPAGEIVFLPDGTTREDAEVSFQAPGCRPAALRLRALTGIVTYRATLGEGGR
jgi:prepilin-type N-terminal cleavage/methylation domain-containing protein